MDSETAIAGILLGGAVLAFGATHAAETALMLLRRSPIREKLMGQGLREAAARNLRANRYAYLDLVHIIRLTSIGATFSLALVLLSNGWTLAWPLTAAGMVALWVVMVLLRPLAVKLVEELPEPALLGLTVPMMLVLWPGLPLARFSYRTMQMGRRAVQAVTGDGFGGAPVEEEEETVEERINEEPLAPQERRMIHAILSLEDTTVREIMRPRVDIVALEVDTPLEQAINRMLESGHSRVPVFQETLDNMLGVLYSRDVLEAVAHGRELTVEELVRPSYFVPESKRVDELLREFQERHVQMGIVIDEYGGVEGIVTIEDLFEEIVGEIEDEFEIEDPTVQRGDDGVTLVDARMKLDAFNAEFSAHITGEGFETVAGFLYSRLGKIPSAGDLVTVNGLRLEVVTTLGRRIKQVKVLVEAPDQAAQAGQSSERPAFP